MASGASRCETNCKIARSPLIYKGRIYHPYFKNIIIGGGLMALGEICSQSIKMYFCGPPNYGSGSGNNLCSACDQESSKKSWIHLITDTSNYNFNTIIRQSAIGSFQGFYQFIYYSWLDKVFSGVSMTVVAKKVVLDEVLIGPISLAIFFLYNGFCDTFTMAGAFQRCRQSFLPGYLSDLVYWPVLQTINFALVPPGYRVLYVIFFTSIWNTYLCFFSARMGLSGSGIESNQ
ncbi:unnamed protein product [Schistosoma rodhaini]|nr:unnamed protein product [Schistosoma rodhaini]